MLAGLVLYCAIDYLATIQQMPWIVVRQNLFYQVEHKYFSTSASRPITGAPVAASVFSG